MNGIHRIDLGRPALFEFRGPDAVRYLNGQLTQDVRRVVDSDRTLPSCVTDAKGRLQFRVWISEVDGALWVEGPAGRKEELETRLTRHLIADDVVPADLTENWTLAHFTGIVEPAPAGVTVRSSERFGLPGTDWWIPRGLAVSFPARVPLLEGDALETFRVARGVPAWGRELHEGILPPEAGLDVTDISYQKGCYVGQEVISRIKSAGKLNRRLVHLTFENSLIPGPLALTDNDGEPAGEITSISPLGDGGRRHALAYVRRGVGNARIVRAG